MANDGWLVITLGCHGRLSSCLEEVIKVSVGSCFPGAISALVDHLPCAFSLTLHFDPARLQLWRFNPSTLPLQLEVAYQSRRHETLLNASPAWQELTLYLPTQASRGRTNRRFNLPES